MLRLPPLRELSSLIARARAGLEYSADTPWEELSVELAAATVRAERGISSRGENAPPSAIARVTRSVRAIERRPDGALGLGSLAREAGLSPYHFLRPFERLTGITPHQYVRRARLRDAASRLAAEREKVLDIASIAVSAMYRISTGHFEANLGLARVPFEGKSTRVSWDRRNYRFWKIGLQREA